MYLLTTPHQQTPDDTQARYCAEIAGRERRTYRYESLQDAYDAVDQMKPVPTSFEEALMRVDPPSTSPEAASSSVDRTRCGKGGENRRG